VFEPILDLACDSDLTNINITGYTKSLYRLDNLVASQRYYSRLFSLQLDDAQEYTINLANTTFDAFITVSRNSSTRWQGYGNSLTFTVGVGETGPMTLEVTTTTPYVKGTFDVELVCNPCVEFCWQEDVYFPKTDDFFTNDFPPANITYDPDNDVYYCSCQSRRNVFAVNATTFAFLWGITGTSVNSSDGDVVYSQDTGFLYSANRGGTGGPTLYEINVGTHSVSRSLSQANFAPKRLLYTPQGDLFVTNIFSVAHGLVKVNPTTFAVAAQEATNLIQVDHMVWCPVNNKLYVQRRSGFGGSPSGLLCIDPTTLAIVASITTPVDFWHKPVFSPVSNKIYIAHSPSSSTRVALVVDPTTNTVVDTIDLALAFPFDTSFTAFECHTIGCYIFVNLIWSIKFNFAIIDPATNTVIDYGELLIVPYNVESRVNPGDDTDKDVVVVNGSYPGGFLRLKCKPVELLSYWKLDETTGNRLDSHNTNHLVPAGTNNSTIGKIGNALSFRASGDLELRKTAATGITLNTEPFTICGWYQKTGVPSSANFTFLDVQLYDGGHSLLWRASLRYNSSGILQFQYGLGAGGDAILTITPSIGVWYFFRLWMSVDGKIHAQFNNGTKYNGSVAITSVPVATTVEVVFGATPVYELLLDEVGIWSGDLSDAQTANLYNSGNGQTYPNLPGI
jgi:hypothetical protein